jgi:hypothetical protein
MREDKYIGWFSEKNIEDNSRNNEDFVPIILVPGPHSDTF